MLNDNFYRGSGITLAIRRLLNSPAFSSEEVFLAGCETVRGTKSDQDDLSFVDPAHYKSFELMQSGPGLVTAILGFVRWVRAMRFDIIHAHHRRLAVLAHLLTPLTRVPVLFTGHLTFCESTWFRELSPRRMTAVSPTVAAYLERCTRARQVDVVYNAVPFEEQDLLPAAQRGAAAVSIGRLEPVKGLDVIIDAFGKLRDRGLDYRIEIYGEGSLRAAHEAQIRDLRLEDRVLLRGFDPEVNQRLRQGAFQVLSSEREGFPNVVVEAAALGIPTLLTNVDGSRDVLPPGLALPNGLPFGDAEALGNALAVWFCSPALVDADGRRFREFLEDRCAPAVVSAGYQKVYRSMVSGSSGAA